MTRPSGRMVRSHRKAGGAPFGDSIRTAKTVVLKGRACGSKGGRDTEGGRAPPTARPTSPSSRGSKAVRKRPGMYIGSTGPTGLHHLVWEVVDNSVDEAMAGRCHPDRRHPAGRRRRAGSPTTGRGIPVGPHPKYPKQSTAEIVLTTLHAGGKFGGKGYQVSGGLHGVGVSVVNALSTRLMLEIDRDGQHWEAEFEKGGKLKRKVTATGPAPKDRSTGEPRTGTTVTFWPDGVVFDETEFRAQTVMERLQIMAFLNKGLEIRFTDERTDPVSKDHVQVQRRHRRLRQAPQRVEGVALPQGGVVRAGRGGPGGRGRAAVEHRLPRVDPLVRQRDLDHRGRHARRRASPSR